MTARIRRKPPTMSEQIEELKAQIQELEQEKAELYERVKAAEASVMESRPYVLLQRKYEELLEIVALRNGTNKPAPQNPKRGRPVSITEEQRARVLQLHADGCSIRTIARETGVSVGSTVKIIRETQQ